MLSVFVVSMDHRNVPSIILWWWLLISSWTVSDVRCQLDIKIASTISTNGNRNVTCSPASNLLIRTAQYVNKARVFGLGTLHHSCTGVDCAFANNLYGYEVMTSEDVMKLYSHCGRHAEFCDVSEAGVKKDFEISYYCLEEPLTNPCSNMTSERTENQLSLLLDYSRHTTARDVTCQCTMTSSGNATVHIRALNFFEEMKGLPAKVVEESENDGNGRVETLMGRGPKSGRGPHVMIDNRKWRWEVERKALPVEWQLTSDENSSVSMMFEHVQGISFGRVWIDLRGQDMQMTCHFTSLPGDSEIPEPSVQNMRLSWWTLVYVSVAVLLAVSLLLVIICIAVARCRARRTSSIESKGPSHQLAPDDNVKANAGGANIPLEGEYCTINEVKDTHASRGQNQAVPHPEDLRLPPMYNETRFILNTHYTVPEKLRPREGKVNHSHGRVPRADQQPGERSLSAGSRGGPGLVPASSEYGTLFHQPGQAAVRRESCESVAVYDHVGVSRWSEGEAEYHRLQRYAKGEPRRVIDNVYDTTASVVSL